jgi:hypothetical protein
MSKREKLLSRLQNSLNDVRFEEACKIAEWIGFKRKGGKGSHCTYAHEGENLLLNFQNRNSFIKPYQARQLLEMVEKYGRDQDLPD